MAREGRLEEAVSTLEQLTQADPSNRSVSAQLVQLYLDLGRYDKVIDTGKKIIARAPREVRVRDLMGVAYLQMGMLDKALQVTNELVHLDPSDPGNHFKRAILFQQKGEIAQAMREFVRVVELDYDGEMAEEAHDAINWLDSYQIRQIVALATEDGLFRAKLARDADGASTERGFFLSDAGKMALRQIDFERLSEPGDWDRPTYH